MPPVTTKDRFALVEPLVIDGKTLDIRFRMLKPHELSAAMGFPGLRVHRHEDGARQADRATRSASENRD
jgi:hypothetical protein